mgnify:CR=1 FL=1
MSAYGINTRLVSLREHNEQRMAEQVIDWLRALRVLGRDLLDEATLAATLGSVLKYKEDQEAAIAAGLRRLIGV